MWKWIAVAWIVLSLLAAMVAAGKGRSGAKVFLLSLLLSPLIGLPAAFLAGWGDRAKPVIQSMLTLCPYCQGLIDIEAEQCPHCLRTLSQETVLWQHNRVRVTTRRIVVPDCFFPVARLRDPVRVEPQGWTGRRFKLALIGRDGQPLYYLYSSEEKRLQLVAEAINEALATAPAHGAGDSGEAWASVPLPHRRRLSAVI